MPKIDPTDTLQSMLDDPSRGSKTTTYFPRTLSSMIMTSSTSSETSTHALVLDRGAHKIVVRQYIELLNFLALHVDAAFETVQPANASLGTAVEMTCMQAEWTPLEW